MLQVCTSGTVVLIALYKYKYFVGVLPVQVHVFAAAVLLYPVNLNDCVLTVPYISIALFY